MQKFKAILADFDGTLVGKDMTISDDLTKQIIQMEINGGIFSIATGRGYYGAVQNTAKKYNGKYPVIVRGGAEIMNPINDQVIYGKYIVDDEASYIINELLNKNIEMYVEKGAFTYSIGAKPGEHAMNESYLDIKTLEIIKIPKILLVSNIKEVLEDIKSEILSKYSDINVHLSIGRMGNYMMDINAQGVSKYNATLKFAELININPSEIIAIGDSYNDKPLFDACGYKIAVGNAVQEIKDIADYIAPSQSEGGIEFIIKKFF